MSLARPVVRPVVRPVARSIIAAGQRALSYVKSGRVFDLGNLGAYTIADKSPEGNDATQESGYFVSTDGTSSDKAVNANWSSLGADTYYLTGKVRPSAVTTAKQTLDGSTASNLTGLTAGVWQDFQTPDFIGTPSLVVLGFDGTVYGAADYSDLRLHTSDGAAVRHCPLIDSGAADLDGVIVAETIAGEFGSHQNCAGGSSEPNILQTAGMDWNKGANYPSPAVYLHYESGLHGGVTSDFNGSASNIVRSTSAPLSGVASAVVSCTTPASSNNSYPRFFTSDLPLTFASGKSYRLTFDYEVLSGAPRVSINAGGNGSNFFVSNATLTGSGSRAYYITVGTQASYKPNSISFNFDSPTSGAFSFKIDNIKATEYYQNVLVPESDTLPGQDALGNAIDLPRINNSVINIAHGSGDTANVADSASLGACRSLGCWYYHDGVQRNISIIGPGYTLYATSSIVDSDLPSPTYHVNGAVGTALSLGWNYIGITLAADADFGPYDIQARSARHIAYTTSMAEADWLTNFNAQKSNFGL